MNRIEEKFKVKSVNDHLIILDKRDAMDFINECEKEAISILGIDAFKIRDGYIQPNQDNSIDFSSQGMDSGIYNEARRLIERTEGNFHFEITCDD